MMDALGYRNQHHAVACGRAVGLFDEGGAENPEADAPSPLP